MGVWGPRTQFCEMVCCFFCEINCACCVMPNFSTLKRKVEGILSFFFPPPRGIVHVQSEEGCVVW